ncbi:hypothetical protein [Algoriphagus terrigena]|uniref:hypothetical protein n=1 Tax=Algoriphagus terrigena TaxID=344884 RepID=UPI0012F9D2F1|nr:hypothetical protein [Algoriphagus terrigena]
MAKPYSKLDHLLSPFFPKVCRFFVLVEFDQKVPFSDDLSSFWLQLFLEEGRKKKPSLIHFCSVADENVRESKTAFSANAVLECPEAIFCMAQPLAHGGRAENGIFTQWIEK